MKTLLAVLISVVVCHPSTAMTLASHGKPRVVIVVDPQASAPEIFAAHELAENLHQITGAVFKIKTNSLAPISAIIIGQGMAASNLFPDLSFDTLSPEEWIIRTKNEQLLLSGGRTRGTLYAVSQFLQQQCGVRWWTPWASRIPRQRTLVIEDLNIRSLPAFEYRAPFWYDAFDPQWSWHNLCNSEYSNLSPEQGGSINYAAFVHTFYQMAPPEQHFAQHPEWYSLVKGNRITESAQLCTTDPALREFLLGRVKKKLSEMPEASIISVSQNDCLNPCECSNCAALDEVEGSHAGSMLTLANYIATNIRADYPNVAIDTLAYQYTRKPPLHLRADSNVIVRLCSIECNFHEPLSDPANASFGDDIRNWAQHANRLYVWDYVTDFAVYEQPFPNWFTLGPNLRFFQSSHVRGVFEEGAYQSHGAEMADLRSWVLAQLMVNPNQDDRALIREYLDGYYGAAGKPIYEYLTLMDEAAKGINLGCYAHIDAPYLNFHSLTQAEKLWEQAEKSVAGDKELLSRVRLGHLPVEYILIARWNDLKRDCQNEHATWPVQCTKSQLIREWKTVSSGLPGRQWTEITQLHEGGPGPATFLTEADAVK